MTATAETTQVVDVLLHVLGLPSHPAVTWACPPKGEYGVIPGETWWVALGGVGSELEAIVVERADRSVTWAVYIARRAICGAKLDDVATAKHDAERVLAVVDRLVAVIGVR